MILQSNLPFYKQTIVLTVCVIYILSTVTLIWMVKINSIQDPSEGWGGDWKSYMFQYHSPCKLKKYSGGEINLNSHPYCYSVLLKLTIYVQIGCGLCGRPLGSLEWGYLSLCSSSSATSGTRRLKSFKMSPATQVRSVCSITIMYSLIYYERIRFA